MERIERTKHHSSSSYWTRCTALRQNACIWGTCLLTPAVAAVRRKRWSGRQSLVGKTFSANPDRNFFVNNVMGYHLGEASTAPDTAMSHDEAAAKEQGECCHTCQAQGSASTSGCCGYCNTWCCDWPALARFELTD